MSEQATDERVDQFETPGGELRFRSAEQIGVSYPKRVIEIVVTPWEEEATVHHEGRLITEVFSKGAYDGIERRANRVRCNRDHKADRTVGRAVAFHPSREEGLVGEFKIAKTLLGDETLALAEEGVLDASAGYLPMANGERWETRNRVRITRAFLGHVAFLPDAAYVGARVLSVRNAAEREAAVPVEHATPNLDEVRGWLLQDKLKEIDAS